MAVLHCAEIIQAVCQSQHLRIGQALTYLLHATVDVAQHKSHFLYRFTLKACTHVKHTVRTWMLRTYINDKFIFAPNRVCSLSNGAVSLSEIFSRSVAQRFVRHAQRILFVRLVVLAEWIANPVFAQEDAAHIWVVQKLDAEKVVNLAFIYIGNLPKVTHRVNVSIVAIRHSGFQLDFFTRLSALQHIDYSKAFLSPVHADEIHEEVHFLFFFQSR